MSLETMDIYSRISRKARNEMNNLSTEEREKLESMCEDNYSEWVSRISDELLLQHSLEKGVI